MRAGKLVFAATVVCFSTPAYAYLDAGTGSMLVQALIGAVSGAFLFGSVYWAKVKAFFKRGAPGDDDPQKTAAEASQKVSAETK